MHHYKWATSIPAPARTFWMQINRLRLHCHPSILNDPFHNQNVFCYPIRCSLNLIWVWVMVISYDSKAGFVIFAIVYQLPSKTLRIKTTWISEWVFRQCHYQVRHWLLLKTRLNIFLLTVAVVGPLSKAIR